MVTEIKAPDRPIRLNRGTNIFLGGSIEMGKAEKWQDRVVRELKESENDFEGDVTIFNPRRDDWDSSWKQEKSDPQFRQQVLWELEHQEKCGLLVYYFAPNTMSPITLLELGLFHESGSEVIVCCPAGYERKGNVDIVCERYEITLVDSFELLVDIIKEKINE